MRGLKILFTVLLSTLLLLVYSKEVFAQVVINEVLPDPAGSDIDNEWIEIYNPSSIQLSGYKLEDNNGKLVTITDSNDKWLSIHPHGVGGFAITNSGTITIKLRDTTDNVIGEFSYSGSTEGKSWGRIPDGGTIFSDVLTPSEGTTNQSPSPTPTATSTSTPTATPTSTPTATPTSTPAATKTPTPKPTKTPSPTPDYTPGTSGAGNSGSEDGVLGIRNELATATPEGGESGGGKPFPVVAGVIMGLGGVCVVGSGVWFFKIRKGTYNGASEENPPTLG